MVDVPSEAMGLGEFVKAEAGDELAAVRVAFERLAAARDRGCVDGASAGFAAAVASFHDRARKRLLTGEFLAFGRPMGGPWAPSVQIDPAWWRGLAWGSDGGLERFVAATKWRPKPAGDWAVAWPEAFGRIELPGGADLMAEVAFGWLQSVRLDVVSRGVCPQEQRNGWRVLGVEYAADPAPLVCSVIRAAAVSPEAACRAWLRGLVEAGDPEEAKPRYLRQAQDRFGVSREAFRFIWAEATRGRTAWTRPGRRS
ncbi:hypothetical protein DF3PA_350011 [Candidatus Defluviicoccus seviourii]|uniref:Uncharacterized protein n=2 Tax=root TaxID=1 RepID=A0A564WG34_9PROT|nr:hypothetical protein DF3PB_80029 [uncultured Defluviicoccus sp.]VUX47079.1 hypothetical protein DF3PA_350011 [Candidatus Defluviicoccus seviourii]